LIYRSRFLTREEVWFDNDPDDTRLVDWILYHQRSRPVPRSRAKYFHTYVIDLTQSCEQLQARLSEDTAYKIRRARDRDKIICENQDPRDPKVISHFEQVYNQFAATKRLAPLDRARTESMAAAGVLDMSVAKDPQGNVLVYHANYRDPRRATGLELPSQHRKFSDSKARNLIGRANRYLTWSEILRYKEKGLKCFDFGGWYHGNDPDMLRVNDFKKGFGGQVVREYNCEQILSLKGWVVLKAANLLKHARLFSSRRKERKPGPVAE
jgi:hypothetical protein